MRPECYKTIFKKLGVLVHTFNYRTWAAEVGGSPWVHTCACAHTYTYIALKHNKINHA